jgi:hypothetical protein
MDAIFSKHLVMRKSCAVLVRTPHRENFAYMGLWQWNLEGVGTESKEWT